MEKTYGKIKDERLAILNGVTEKSKQLGFDTEKS